MAITDMHGNALTGATSATADIFNMALEAFNIYRGDPVGMLDKAILEAPDFSMAHILKAHLFALATEPAASVVAATIVAHVKTLRMDVREASHVAAIDMVLAGEWTAAAEAFERHSMRYPLDLVALQIGHLMDFYRASARSLRDRIARVLPLWNEGVAGHSIVLGMHAFGLEESGDYSQAEAVGREAIAINPLDCWAHHAVAHVMEMQGRAEDGIGWMIAREPYWTGDDNFFKVHNWWHRSLCHLDLGQMTDVLALYDGHIRKDRSNIVLDMVDASALLWRLNLCGHDVGNRWVELAEAWDQHADGKTYAFNDWHGVMAYLGAGRSDDAERIITAHRNASRSEQDHWAHSTGLPLAEGFAAFWRGEHETAVNKLWGARTIANRFGGSHAQRDIIDWTLTEAALRGGISDVAEAMARERMALKPHSPVNRSFLSRSKSSAVPLTEAA